MKIEEGGQTERLEEKVKTIAVNCESECICLWINRDSLSYLSIDEAIALRDELNAALKQRLGLGE